MIYDLSHLTQESRRVYGPVQDDEALLLYAMIRCVGARRVLEVGGQTGYSARNFLAAVGPDGEVFTIDLEPVERLADNHTVIQSDIGTADLSGIPPCDVVFYDAHALEPQTTFHGRAEERGVIHAGTIVVCHDTGLHREQWCGWAEAREGGWAHQPAERQMAGRLVLAGYHAVHLHDDGAVEPRHGLTILQRPRRLA